MIPVFDSLRTPFNVTMSLMYFSGHISNDSQVYVVLKKTAPLKLTLAENVLTLLSSKK